MEKQNYTTIEICNNKSKQLNYKYNALKSREKQLIAELEKIREELINLRNEEVNNVTDFIRAYFTKLNEKEIDTLLCHNQNVLNGNVDGCFITYTEDMFKGE